MSGLFDSLTTASRLTQQRMGLDVAAKSANVFTAASAAPLVLQEVPPSFNGAGRGVEVIGIPSSGQLPRGRIRREQSSSSYGGAVVDTLERRSGDQPARRIA
jgi:hypothetical protein